MVMAYMTLGFGRVRSSHIGMIGLLCLVARIVRPLGLHYNHFVSLSDIRLSTWYIFYHILHTYACKHSLTTDMQTHPVWIDMGLQSNCRAFCGQLVKILITLQPYRIFG